MSPEEKLRNLTTQGTRHEALREARLASFEAGKARALRHQRFTGDKSSAPKEDISGEFRFAEVSFGHRGRTAVVREVSGWIGDPQLVTKHRNPAAQARSAGGTGWDADHYGANNLGFPGDERNLSHGNPSVNRGPYRTQIERKVATMVEKGSAVYVAIRRVFLKGKEGFGAERHVGTSLTCVELNKNGQFASHTFPLVANPDHPKPRTIREARESSPKGAAAPTGQTAVGSNASAPAPSQHAAGDRPAGDQVSHKPLQLHAAAGQKAAVRQALQTARAASQARPALPRVQGAGAPQVGAVVSGTAKVAASILRSFLKP